ncbi:PASTA domain-containing protein [Winogradskyella sp.]|mgnify:CR=1 FL=1|uniref:PASTA domain-containing protein n=1 Tax=uncultured Winogradskyella sp. TaxID=395353 RepID=UPI00236E7EF2|nr:PASTA domain-containing protein [Winogradskyella sp.]|tara:strand:+ start:45984 stop:46532 length:549 start_codon:yes stop_codon:yes gene_type:complete
MSFVKFITSKVFFKQLALAIVAVVVLCFIVLKWLNITTNHNEFVIVPDLKGKSVETVKIELKDNNLAFKLQDSANFNPNYPKYSVIEQSPKAGEKVKENRKIYLITNPSGYRKVTVPNVLKRTLRQARPQLEALEFKIGNITFKDAIGEGVMSMSHKGKPLKPGDVLPLTSKIDLVVGNGKL